MAVNLEILAYQWQIPSGFKRAGQEVCEQFYQPLLCCGAMQSNNLAWEHLGASPLCLQGNGL